MARSTLPHTHTNTRAQSLVHGRICHILLHWFNSHLTTLARPGTSDAVIHLPPPTLAHFNCQFACALHVSLFIPLRFASLRFVSFRFGFKYWIGYWVSVSVSHSVPHTPVDSSANRFASYLENLCGAKARCLSDKLAAAWKRETVRPLSTHRQTDTRPDTHPVTHTPTHTYIHTHRQPHTVGSNLYLALV